MVGKQEELDNAKSSKQLPWSSQRENIGSSDPCSPGIYRTTKEQDGTENQSFRSFGTNTERENVSTTINREGGHTKKLASQLELLKEAFYEYVGAHRGRLEQRLDENKQFTQIFEERLAALEQEVLGSPQHHNE